MVGDNFKDIRCFNMLEPQGSCKHGPLAKITDFVLSSRDLLAWQTILHSYTLSWRMDAKRMYMIRTGAGKLNSNVLERQLMCIVVGYTITCLELF